MPLFGFFSGTNYVIQKRNSAKDGVGVGTYSAIVVLLAVSSFWSPHELWLYLKVFAGVIPPQRAKQYVWYCLRSVMIKYQKIPRNELSRAFI